MVMVYLRAKLGDELFGLQKIVDVLIKHGGISRIIFFNVYQRVPSGYVKIAMERSTILNGKIHELNGHFP